MGSDQEACCCSALESGHLPYAPEWVRSKVCGRAHATAALKEAHLALVFSRRLQAWTTSCEVYEYNFVRCHAQGDALGSSSRDGAATSAWHLVVDSGSSGVNDCGRCGSAVLPDVLLVCFLTIFAPHLVGSNRLRLQLRGTRCSPNLHDRRHLATTVTSTSE